MAALCFRTALLFGSVLHPSRVLSPFFLGNARCFGGGRSSFLTPRCGRGNIFVQWGKLIVYNPFWEALVASVAGAFHFICAWWSGW